MRLRCLAIFTVLAASSFSPPAGGLFAQTAPPHTPVVDSLQFSGGTVGEFVDMFARDQGINVVLRRGVKDLPMPPVDLKRVSKDDIVDLICALASNDEADARIERMAIGSQQGIETSRVYVLSLVRKAKDPDPLASGKRALYEVGSLARQSSPQPAAQRSVQVVSLKGAAQAVGRVDSSTGGLQTGTGTPTDAGGGRGAGGLSGPGVAAMEEKARNYDTVLTAIETALKFRGEPGDEAAEIKFHAESGLLFVRAIADQHKMIQDVVDQLDGSATRRERAKEKELSESIRDLREEIRALNNLGQMQAPMQGGMDDRGSFRSNLLNRSLRAPAEKKRYPLEKTQKTKPLDSEVEDPLGDPSLPKPDPQKP